MRFWRVLESVPGPAAVLAKWRDLVGDEIDRVTPYLQPDTKLATTFPISGDWRSYRVVEHGPDDFVGICDELGKRIVLTRADLVVWRINWPRLLADVAATLGFDPPPDVAAGLPTGTRHAGAYRPTAGYTFPVYLVATLESQMMTVAICQLAFEPVVVLAPTRSHLEPQAERVIERSRSCFLALDDAIGGDWQATEPAQQTLRAFLSERVPAVNPVDCTFFRTPPDATWAEVSIRFLDGHSVSVKCRDAKGVFDFQQMGMADQRSAKPTRQWDLLRAFAKGNGAMNWKSAEADAKNQKRRELLARDLRAFFRIDHEPIGLTENRKGWKTKFEVIADVPQREDDE